MAKPAKQAHRDKGDDAKRYRSIAEVKRDLFPNAAAEEAEHSTRGRGEMLMDDLFGSRHHSVLSGR